MLYIIFICILQKIDYSFPIPGNGAYCEFCCHILKLFSCSEEMKIIFFVFLALLVSVQSKPFTESTESVSSRNYFHFTIKKLATREDSTGLCTVRRLSTCRSWSSSPSLDQQPTPNGSWPPTAESPAWRKAPKNWKA